MVLHSKWNQLYPYIYYQVKNAQKKLNLSLTHSIEFIFILIKSQVFSSNNNNNNNNNKKVKKESPY